MIQIAAARMNVFLPRGQRYASNSVVVTSQYELQSPRYIVSSAIGIADKANRGYLLNGTSFHHFRFSLPKSRWLRGPVALMRGQCDAAKNGVQRRFIAVSGLC